MNLSKAKWGALVCATVVLAACTTNKVYVTGSSLPHSAAKSDRVIVMIDDNHCPVAVVALGSECPPGLDGPGNVCRAPSPPNQPTRIKWEAEPASSNSDFEIAYPHGSPCVGSAPRECTIKDASSLSFTAGDILPFKYDVVPTDRSKTCKLDPYIIVMDL